MTDLAHMPAVADVARTLLGEPEERSGAKLRFEKYSLDMATGNFYDFSTETRIDVVDLVAREKLTDRDGAAAWLEDNAPEALNGHAPKRLPEDLAAERALIGLILVRPAVLALAEEEIGASDFIAPLHGHIFTVFLDARDNSYDTDVKTLVAALGSDNEKEVAPGYTLWKYVAHLAASAPVVLEEQAPDLARLLAREIRQVADVERGEDAAQAEIAYEPEPVKPWQSRFGLRRWEEIGRAAKPYPWVIENLIPEAESVVIFGQSGSGKSFDSFDMAMCIARGLKFNGLNVEPGLVIYVAAEAGKGFEKRKLAYCTHHGLKLHDPLPFALLTKRPDLFSSDADTSSLIEEINTVAKTYELPLRAVFLDTVSALTPGMNENASADVSKVRMRIDRIRDAVQAATILVHHTPKSGAGPRGHGSFTADFETTIAFETVEDLYDDERRPVHRATIVKQREGRRGLTWEFVLQVVEVGKNQWGNPETSCVVLPREKQREGRGPTPITPQQQRFMKAVYAALDAHGVAPATVGVQLPRSITRIVEYRHVKAIFARGELNDGEDPRDHAVRLRQALSRSRKDLTARAFVGADDPYIWPTGRAIAGMAGTQTEAVTSGVTSVTEGESLPFDGDPRDMA